MAVHQATAQWRIRRAEAAELRHRRRVELAQARAGQLYAPVDSGQVQVAEPVVFYPHAVIPSPPGAKPVQITPGPCRHERIVPVINGSGELEKWVCANYPRCLAEFDKSVAIYAEDD
jgi:hypothetical protein